MCEIQTWFKNMGDGACLALDYIFSTLKGKEVDEFTANCYCLAGLYTACYKGLVDPESGYVKDAVKLLELSDQGSEYEVLKKDIESIKDVRDDVACVAFSYKDATHWVLADHGVIVFDPLDDSQCRKYGKPVSARVIIKKGENK